MAKKKECFCCEVLKAENKQLVKTINRNIEKKTIRNTVIKKYKYEDITKLMKSNYDKGFKAGVDNVRKN